MTRLVLSLLLTEAVELPLSIPFLRRKEGLLIVFLVNILTNPFVVYCCILAGIFLPEAAYYPLQIVLEAAVVITEGLIYSFFSEWFCDGKHPFRMSLILNAVSYGIGILINIGVQCL